MSSACTMAAKKSSKRRIRRPASRRKSTRKWSARVTQRSNALDLDRRVFTWKAAVGDGTLFATETGLTATGRTNVEPVPYEIKEQDIDEVLSAYDAPDDVRQAARQHV